MERAGLDKIRLAKVARPYRGCQSVSTADTPRKGLQLSLFRGSAQLILSAALTGRQRIGGKTMETLLEDPMTRISRSKLSLPLAAAASIALAGCGGSAPPPPQATNEQVVFVTTQDCTSTGKLKPAECAAAVKKALEDHLANSPTYRSLVSCEKSEGEQKCERMDEKTFRPRLMAMSVAVPDLEAARQKSQPVPVVPLYATMGGEAGFRTLAKVVLKGDDEMIRFTPKAVAVYSPFVKASSKLF